MRDSYRISLSDCGDIGELYAAIYRCFPNETNPELRFTEWSGMPEGTVAPDSISADIYDLLDALDAFEIDDCERFDRWCAERGYAPSSDDIHLLAAQYRETYGAYLGATAEPPDDENTEETDMAGLYPDDTNYDSEIFDENYD